MALPEFSMRQLLEAGAHFGHQTHRWNPKMDRFIFGEKSNIHIIDLSQTVPLLHQALLKVREVAAGGGRILFVGTKRQAADHIKSAAQRCAQYYVNSRWLGGTLDQLANRVEVDRAPARTRPDRFRRQHRPDQEGSAEPDSRARQARPFARRHRGHGRHPEHDVRDRHQQGSDRHSGSQEARHSGCGRDRLELRPGRSQLPDPGQ